MTLDLLIKDLFYDLIYRASNLLEQNFDVTYDKRLIRNMLYNLQIVPQYAVFYYMDRVEIYRCDSETEEHNFIFSPIDTLKNKQNFKYFTNNQT